MRVGATCSQRTASAGSSRLSAVSRTRPSYTAPVRVSAIAVAEACGSIERISAGVDHVKTLPWARTVAAGKARSIVAAIAAPRVDVIVRMDILPSRARPDGRDGILAIRD